MTAPLLRKAGSYEVLVTLSDGGAQDLLVGTLRIPAASGQGSNRPTRRPSSRRQCAGVAGGANLARLRGHPVAGRRRRRGAVLSGRRKMLYLASRNHRSGPDLSWCVGARGPRSRARPECQYRQLALRRPDGSMFVPKPTQRLLEIRTRHRRSRAGRERSGSMAASWPTRTAAVWCRARCRAATRRRKAACRRLARASRPATCSAA